MPSQTRLSVSKSPGSEALIIARELATYRYESSPVWVHLQRQFGSGIRASEIRSLAEVISLFIPVPGLTRSERRSYPLVIRWFETYWCQIEPILPLFGLRDAQNEEINFAREQRETMRNHRDE